MEERSLSVIRISVRNLVEFVLRSGDLVKTTELLLYGEK